MNEDPSDSASDAVSAEPTAASWLPQTLLLLGTDAAGKNHVARVWARRMAEQGLETQIQEGWLAGSPADPEMEDEKSVPVNAEECLGCESCVEVCEEEAIVVEET